MIKVIQRNFIHHERKKYFILLFVLYSTTLVFASCNNYIDTHFHVE